MELLEQHPDLTPGQVGALGRSVRRRPPYPMCGLGFRVTSNNHGLSNLASSRLAGVVPHRDLVAGLHRDAVQSRCRRMRLRRMKIIGEAHRTISSTAVAATPSKSAHHLSRLVGIASERHHAVTDGVARGFVARGRQQDEERGDLGRCQPLAVDLGLHQVCGEVVGGPGPAVLGELHAVLRQFGDRAGLPRRIHRPPPRRHRHPESPTSSGRPSASSSSGMPIMSQMICSGSELRDLGDEVGLCVGDGRRRCRSPIACARLRDAVLDADHHLGREGAVDDLCAAEGDAGRRG